MPTVKIELLKGKSKNEITSIRNLVMNAVVNSLSIPENDRNIRIIEYEAGFFELKPPYKMLIEIALFAGRKFETKKLLYKSITESISNSGIFNKDEILIFLNEQPLENWAGRGGIPANEMNLGFQVNK